jgi:hypothetical protein
MRNSAQAGLAAKSRDDRHQSTFAYRIERWDPSGNVVQRVADVDDLAVAVATYEAACKRWPDNHFTLRKGSRLSGQSTNEVTC